MILVLGVTASGKGRVAFDLARELGGEIVSIDSMKVYRGMDVGTAKPDAATRATLPHHLLDVADPWEHFSVARFVALADEAVTQIHGRGRPAIAVGGTTLYLKAFYEGLFEGPSADAAFRAAFRERAADIGPAAIHAELAKIDPAAAQRIHPQDLRRVERALEIHQLTGRPITELQREWTGQHRRRPDWHWLLIGLRRERESGNRRVNERVRRMVAAGLVDEVRRLASDPRGLSPTAAQAVGYAELLAHFRGALTLDEALEQVKINTRRLAKHQRSWMKRLPDVQWLDADELDDAQLLDAALGLVTRP